jgi:hypothetical protein
VLLCQGCTSLRCDRSVGQVILVGHEDFTYATAGMLVNLLQPVLDVVESCFLRAIVHQYYSHCSLIIRLRDCSESFLPCSVPHLELYSLVPHRNGLDLKVNTDGGHVAGGKVVLWESEQDATLAHTGISNDD